MTPIEQESTINGVALRLAREARGWALSDMATRSCMSTRQIRQLEEGGSSSFYSVSVKLTAVKKVGALLGLSQEQWFIAPAPAVALSTDAAMVTASQAQADALANVSSISPSQVEASALMPKAKVSLWTILALFTAALGVAAVMRPAPEPVATESVPPPVLTLPEGVQEGVEKAMTPASDVIVPNDVASAAGAASASAAKPL